MTKSKKIQVIELKDMRIVKEGEEYKQVFENEEILPCFLTNSAVKKGKDMGLLFSSLVADMMKLHGFANAEFDSLPPELLENLDETEMQKVIYLGILGANKSRELTFDQFLDKFHYTFEDVLEIYMDIMQSLISSDPNAFAKGLKKSTKASGKKK